MPGVVGGLIISGLEAAGASGVAGFSLGSTTIFGTSLATVVGTTAIIGASIGLQFALRPGVPKPADGAVPIQQAIPSRIWGVGLNRLAGFYMLFESASGSAYTVTAFHSGRISAIRGFYLHDDVIQVSTGLTGAYGTVLSTYADGRYSGGRISIEARLGLPSQSPAQISFDPNMGSTWNPAHVGNGIAWLAMVCNGVSIDLFTKIYPRGLPLPSLIADCLPCWDPRNPSQSRSDDSNWTVSYNPVIQIINYQLRARKDGGLGRDYASVIEPNLDALMFEANLCDESVEKADGTFEQRYQCHAWFRFDNNPEDVFNTLLSSCDGWMSEDGDGAMVLTVGFYREPTVTLTVEDFLPGFAVKYGEADESTVNVLDISFTDPTQNFVEVQTDPWRDEDSISEIGEKSQPLDLKPVQSPTQARRLADRAMQRLNADMTGSCRTKLSGFRALGQRWVRLQYPYLSGLQDCVVEIQDGTEYDLLGGWMSFNFIRIAPDAIEAYDPNVDEGVLPAPLPPGPGSVLFSLDFTEPANSGYHMMDWI
jgi:hypothetical protein